jgi:putative ABC transport system permease protein
MSLWRQLARGIRSLVHRTQTNEEIAAEIHQYLDDATADGVARGLSFDDARRAARLELGNTSAVHEQVRSYGWENGFRSLLFDLRYAARQLGHHPGFTIVSVVTLTLGIGASTAIFSAVNPILLSPLPYPHPNRILMIWNTYQGARSELSFGTFYELSRRSRSFEAMTVFEPWQPTMTGDRLPERLEGQSVSAAFLRVLGVEPRLGRDFLPSEEGSRAPRRVILSDRLWRRIFNRDRSILGRELKLDDDNYTIIGVMPAEFENVLSPSADIWTTQRYDPATLTPGVDSWAWAWGLHIHIAGRLKPGASMDQAVNELSQIARTPWPEFPRPRWASLNHGLIIDSLQADIAHTVKPALLAILGAVVLVLAIACVNVVNLLLARCTQRGGEFAVRAALGASRHRVLRQLITESLLLAGLGGIGGIGVAFAGVRALISLSPPGLPRLDAIAVDPAALAFALAITTLIGVFTGLVPAAHLSRAELHSALHQSSRRAANGQSLTRRALVVTSVALAFVLLISAGLLLHSMQRLLSVDPGFNPDHLLTMQVQTSGHQFDELPNAPGAGDAARRRFFEQALEAVRRVPTVKQAAVTSLLALSDDPPVMGMYGARFESDGPDGGRNVFRYAVSPQYCQAMGIPLRSGRYLDERDSETAPYTALVSESLARSKFPGQDPIGKRLHVGPPNRPWYTVVGVVADVKQTSLAINDPDAVYLSTRQTWFADESLSFVIRTSADAASLAPAVKNAIWSIDRNQPIVRVETMKQLVDVSEAERRFVLILFAAFGITALLLAAVGIYGVLSGSVNDRMREIGVRAALGASRRDILSLIMHDGMILTAAGISIGLAVSAAASQTLITLLFGISPLDPSTYLGVVALLVAVALTACATPAWRAARVDPSITLRAD